MNQPQPQLIPTLTTSTSTSTSTTTTTNNLPIDSLRLKLVQTIDQLTSLQSNLHYHKLSTPEPSTNNPGILTFPELLIQFNLLLSHIVGLGGILSDAGLEGLGVGGGEGERKGDKKKEKWENMVVVPKVEVEESRDWIVGMLLRTKQTPIVETHLQNLLSSLPSHLSSTSPSSSTTSAAIARQQHESLIKYAHTKILELKETASTKKGGRGEEWDWKLRVDVDDDDEDSSSEDEEDADNDREGDVKGMETGEDGEKEKKEKKQRKKKQVVEFGAVGRKWTLAEVLQFQKSGEMP